MSQSELTFVVLDTHVVSSLYKNTPLADQYARHLQGHHSVISFQTLAELRRGMEKARWGNRRRADQEGFISRFGVTYPTQALCTLWGTVMNESRASGVQIDTADAWIAATALALKCPLVTHNAADFSGIPNLKLISEPLQ